MQCSGSVTFWYGFEFADPYLLLTDPALDPALFVSDLQDANQKKKNLSFFAYYFSFIMEGPGSESESGPVTLTNGSGRPQKLMDPTDPEH
jgi:hypothetical protein